MRRPRLASPREEHSLVVGRIASVAGPSKTLEILEAGCGREWSLSLSGTPYRLTGLDLDAKALEARRSLVGDLDAAIVGDLRTADLPAEAFDVIVCFYVLEHVAGAGQVLVNFSRWLRPGGLLVVRVPDRDSAFGFVARKTPFWFHVAVWRYVYGSPDAGRPGHAPYPTAYDPVLGTAAMESFCRQHGLDLIDVVGHSGLDGSGLLRRLAVGLLRALAVLSAGRLAADHNNLTFVVSKPAAPATAP